jgi:PAS domain S-box-containing protein
MQETVRQGGFDEGLRGHLGPVLRRLADGITVISRDGRIVYANETAVRMCGFESAEELTRTPADAVLERFILLDEDGLPLETSLLPGRMAFRGEETERLVRFRPRDTGEERWSLVRATPLFDEDGAVNLVVNVLRDVTEEQRTSRRLRFLAQASELLASSLDYEATLARVARLAVPELADWCVVDVLDKEENVVRVAVVCADPEKEALARRLRDSYPVRPERPEGTSKVLRRGEPELTEIVTAEWLQAIAPDEEQLEILRSLGLRSNILVPLIARGRTLGVLTLATAESGRTYGADDLALAADLARRAAVAVDNAGLYSSEQLARAEAELAAEALERLGAITQVTLERLSLGDLLDELLARIADLLDADTATILLLDATGEALEVRATVGLDEELRRATKVPLGQGMAGRVAVSREPLVAPDLDEIELVSPVMRLKGVRSLVAIPLIVEGDVIGVMHAGSLELARFDDDDVRLLQLVADRIALAIHQASLYEAEQAARAEVEASQQRLAFLAGASTVLASSLDYEATLARVAELAVPALADWAVVDVCNEQGLLERVAMQHGDPEMSARMGEIDRRWPTGPGATRGPYAVLRTAEPELVAEIADELIATHAADEEHAGAVRQLGLKSYMCVPLLSRERVLGVITFITAESGRTYGEQELALAEDLARRAAAAIENAQLYRSAEERGQAARVLAAVGDGVFLLDRAGVVRYWNPAAAAITGLAESDVLGRPAAEAFPGWSEVADRVPLGVRAETLPLGLGTRELWLSISGVGFSDGTVYAFRDVTQERGLEEMKADFVSTVSHELRTPLAAIYGAAMTLRRTELQLEPEQRDGLLTVIADESERLARIVNDILWASRLDSGQLHISIQRCDPRELAHGVIEAMKAHIPPSIELRLEADGKLPEAEADPDKVRQVLVNLLDNAVKYSPDGGEVLVGLRAGEGYVRFSVHDEGLGIPVPEQQRIFEKFYRLDPNLTRGVGGTGLGLYICRELIRRMGGRIWVESRRGAPGSTFVFELPLVPA